MYAANRIESTNFTTQLNRKISVKWALDAFKNKRAVGWTNTLLAARFVGVIIQNQFFSCGRVKTRSTEVREGNESSFVENSYIGGFSILFLSLFNKFCNKAMIA